MSETNTELLSVLVNTIEERARVEALASPTILEMAEMAETVYDEVMYGYALSAYERRLFPPDALSDAEMDTVKAQYYSDLAIVACQIADSNANASSEDLYRQARQDAGGARSVYFIRIAKACGMDLKTALKALADVCDCTKCDKKDSCPNATEDKPQIDVTLN